MLFLMVNMRKNGESSPRRPLVRQAMALLIVLWLLVMLAVAAVFMIQAVRLENAARQIACEQVQARWLARAGVQQALAALMQDANTTDNEKDPWCGGEDFINVHLDAGTFSTYRDFSQDGATDLASGVRDEASRLNLNTATKEELLRLANITPEIVAELLRERDIRPYGSLREIAQRTEISLEVLYGEDRNLNARLDDNEDDGDLRPPADDRDGQLERGLLAWLTVYSYERNVDGLERPRININTASLELLLTQLQLSEPMARWVLRRRGGGFTSIADLLVDETEAAVPAGEEKIPAVLPLTRNEFRRIVDRITVTDEPVIPGRVNINTAPPEILAVLPGLDEALAQRICLLRQTLPEGFPTIGDLLDVPEMTIERFRRLAESITVRSNVFTIRSLGRAEATGMTHEIEAVIDRGADPDRLLYWRETR